MEPYIHLIRNRNQRSSLTRLRISAHSLATELGRRSRPVIPYDKRTCSFWKLEPNCLPNQTCSAFLGYVDSEAHFLTQCTRFTTTRKHFYSKIAEAVPGFVNMKDDQKCLTLMCPTTVKVAKLTNKMIKFMFEKRAKIEEGFNPYEL